MGKGSIFELADEAAKELVTVQLGKTMLDGKPAAVRARPMRPGDWYAMRKSLPIPSASRGDGDWTTEEKLEWWGLLAKIIPHVVVEARHVAAIGDPPEFIESWISVEIVDDKPDRSKNQMSILELDRLGDAVARIGNAVLESQDLSNEMRTLPAMEADPETGEPFRMESEQHRDPSLVGGKVRGDAARVASRAS